MRSSEYSAQMVKQLLKTRISAQLNRKSDQKCLFAHKQILTLLNYIFEFKFQSYFPQMPIYSLIDNSNAIDCSAHKTLIFFISSKPSSMSTIASIVLHNKSRNIQKQYLIYFFPFGSSLCQEQLGRMLILPHLTMLKFSTGFVPIKANLFSLEISQQLTGVQTEKVLVEALLRIQFVRGSFSNVYAKGTNAKRLMQALEKRRMAITQIVQTEQDQDLLIVLERKQDMVTPNLTALSYQCLLDFFFGISMNRINVPGQIFGDCNPSVTFLLNNKKDPVYESIYFMNIKDVIPYLQKQSSQLKRKIKQQKQKAINLQDLNILNNTLMVEYLLIQNHQSLALYIISQMQSIPFTNSLILESEIVQSQVLTPYDQISYLSLFYPIQHCLRLIALHSNTVQQGRYYSKNEKPIIDILMDAGHVDHIPTLYNLVKAEILRQSKFKGTWKQIRQKFQLVPQQNDCYTDLNIIYSALSVKIVQLILKNRLDPERSALVSKQIFFRGNIPQFKKENKIYVLMIGGLSYNQISCFKAFEKHQNKNIVLLTTQILGNNSLVKKVMFDSLA